MDAKNYGGVLEQLNSIPEPSAHSVSTGFLVILGLLVCVFFYQQWFSREARDKARKAKRTREAMDIRQVRMKELLTEVIGDGLFDAEMAGKISEQELKKLYKEISKKLDLPDLVPHKARAKIVKEGIKARLHKGHYDKCPKIPGPKPGEETPLTGVKAAIQKYWPGKAA